MRTVVWLYNNENDYGHHLHWAAPKHRKWNKAPVVGGDVGNTINGIVRLSPCGGR